MKPAITFLLLMSTRGGAAVQVPGSVAALASAGPMMQATPYHFTEAERVWFLQRHRHWPDVDAYLRDPSRTPWGIVVSDYGREFLVFEDARSALHVIEVTGQPMAAEVVKSPYESPRFDVVGL